MELTPSIVTGLAALGGSLIGGIMTLLGAKISSDKEYRQKQEEVLRGAAERRIKNLYEPLMNMMSPAPPYDEFYIERDLCSSIISHIEKNERYASSDLLRIFWQLRSSYFNDHREIEQDTAIDLYSQAIKEYEKLKELLGYGSIVKGDSSSKKLIAKIIKTINYKMYSFKRAISIKRIKRRFKNWKTKKNT